MKICMIVREYPSSLNEPIVSGEIKNPFYLSQMLKKMGYKVTVITHNKDIKVQNFNGVQIYSIGSGFLKGVVRSITSALNEAKCYLKLIKKEDFDIIHAHIPVIGLILLRKFRKIKTPIITTAHGTSLQEAKANIEGRSVYSTLAKLNSWIQYYIDRFSWLGSDKVISAGNYQVREMLEVYKLPEEKVIPISNGVDTSFYKPDPKAGNKIKEKYGIEDKKIVLFVGRLVRKKGLQYLIDSALLILREVPDTVFLVVGGTDKFAQYELELRKRIRHLDLEEKFIIVKNVPEKDMPSYYNAADVCVFPSINYEPLPTVIFEAMACGKPIVASNLGGIPEQLGYKDTLVPQKNFIALAKMIIKILKDDSLAKELSNKNRKRAKEFHWEKISKMHVELYRGVVYGG